MNPFPKRLINWPGHAGRLATFYCSARLHIINPTSQWNCPGNSPLNYRVWFLVYKALSYHLQWVQAASTYPTPVYRILSGGLGSTKDRRMFKSRWNGAPAPT